MKHSHFFLLIAAALSALAGCGTARPPLPPSLQLPQPPQDLAAARKGDKVHLVWTQPLQNTDGTLVSKPIVERICRAVDVSSMADCPEIAGELPAAVPKQKQTLEFTDTLSAELMAANPTGTANYVVEGVNRHGHSAGPSNQVQVPLAETLPPPQGMQVQVTDEGMVISFPAWSQSRNTADLKFSVRILRHTEGPAPQATGNSAQAPPVDFAVGDIPAAPNPKPQILDRNFEWEKTYSYRATTVTTVLMNGLKVAEIEGEDSAPVSVLAHDIFPPAVPAEVEAVASGVGQAPFVDLTWAPDTDADLAGYNVYRHEGAGRWTKLNAALLTTPSYRDNNVQRGHAYTYAVSAVDVRANESAKSQETSEAVP
jgi:predicted small lipoprotein YifL